MEQKIKTPKFPKLEGLLASRGISTPVLAGGIEMSDQAVRRRLNGDVEFSLDEIVKLCSFLNCDFSDIFDE